MKKTFLPLLICLLAHHPTQATAEFYKMRHGSQKELLSNLFPNKNLLDAISKKGNTINVKKLLDKKNIKQEHIF